MQIAFILPLYEKFGYGYRSALSFFKYTDDGFLIVVDDASPSRKQQNWNDWLHGLPQDRVHFQLYEKHGGLTRSWNYGLEYAIQQGCEYAIAGNSDILFTPGWSEGLIHNLNRGYHLLGPVTNAPGTTNGGAQRVHNYYPGYRAKDDAESLKKVAEYLRKHRPLDEVIDLPVNGFFQMAKTATWDQGRYRPGTVYNPKNKMTRNEDELQGRWKRKGWRCGFVPSSYIFHYRAVSRGRKYRQGDWLRLDDLHKPV